MQTLGSPLIAAILALLTVPSLGQPVSTSQSLRFSTTDQSLWGPGVDEVSEGFNVAIVDLEDHESDGEWYEDVTISVDNDAAVELWERAVRECDNYTHRIGPFAFSPTRSQCINGARPCWPDPTWSDPFRVRCITIQGIGPRPAGSINKQFDIGARVSLDSKLRSGLMGGVTVDKGRVDATYEADVRLEADVESVEAGEVFTLRTRIVSDDASLSTQWPTASGHLTAWIDAEVKLTAETAGPNTTNGAQIRDRATLFERTTGGVKPMEILSFEQSLGNFSLSVLGDPFIEVDSEIEIPLTVGVNLPGVGEVGVSVGDIGVYLPKLATPVVDDLAASWQNGTFDGTRIMNILEPGRRELFSFGFIQDGRLDTDLLRLDNDLDAFFTAATGVPLGVVGRLGAIGPVSLLSVEANLLDIDLAQFMGVRQEYSFEPRLMAAIRFNQRVEIETFPGTNQFELLPAGTPKRIAVGRDLRVVHPGGDLEVSPVYTLEENEFFNDTDLVVNYAIQGTMAQLKLGGLLFQGLGGLGMPTNMALAQVTAELVDEPLKLADLSADDGTASRFPLLGFRDVPGESLTIRGSRGDGSPPAPLFQRGDCNGDGGIDLSDVVCTFRWILVASFTAPCLAASDANGDSVVDPADVVYLFKHLFRNGPDLAAPFGQCGSGTLASDAAHGCETSSCL